MADRVVLVSLPGLRAADLDHMPILCDLARQGTQAPLVPSFPCVTCPVQANMTTGTTPDQHGVVANGFYWRERREVEMWTAWNEVVQRPQIWDLLHERRPGTTAAAWFPLNVKGAGADFICTPAPIHNPDGTESLWCYTKPEKLYGELLDRLGHFPLQHFWGPLAGIQSSQWIVQSAVIAARQFRPDLFYIYLPHLDYAAQKHGPESPQATAALGELDDCIGTLRDGLAEALGENALWIVVSEYVITPVSDAVLPNRALREAGLLTVREQDGHEHLDFARSRAWALVDHQFAHVFVADREDISRVADVLCGQPGVGEVLAGADRGRYHLDHPRSGELVLLADPDRWFAYYWWLEDGRAPAFARTVDIHRKPGFDPVELFFDPATKSVPLQPALVRGSHGLPADDASRRGVMLASRRELVKGDSPVRDTEVAGLVLSALDAGGPK